MRQTLPQHRSGTENSRCWLPTIIVFPVCRHFAAKVQRPKSNENSEFKQEKRSKTTELDRS